MTQTFDLNTYYAKRIIGDNAAKEYTSALLQSGYAVTTDTWIFSQSAHATASTPTKYGILYLYDSTSAAASKDKIGFMGGNTESTTVDEQTIYLDVPTAWVQLRTGDTYFKGKVGIGYDPNSNNNTYKLRVEGGRIYFNYNTAATSTLSTGQLQIANENDGAISIELRHVEKGSWQVMNTGDGDLYFRNNVGFIDATESLNNIYNSNSLVLYRGTGIGSIPVFIIGTTNTDSEFNTTYKLYVKGASYLNGTLTLADHLYLAAAKHIYMHYGDNDYAVLFNHNNGNISLRAAGSGLYLGYDNTSETRMYYSDGTTSRTEFLQINSDGAYALTRFGVAGQSTDYTLYVNGTANITNTLYLTRTTDAEATSDNRPALIIGSITGQHLELDGNEIMSKSDATTATTLYLNNNGGNTKFGGNVGIKMDPTYVLDVAGHIRASSEIYTQTSFYAHGNLLLRYNNAWWNVVVNYGNGNTGLNACGGGVYMGYSNTTLMNWLDGKMTLNSSGDLLVTRYCTVNNRIYAKEWIQFDNWTGLYSPNNNAHFYPNNSTSYGAWCMNGGRGGYYGVSLGPSNSYLHVICDSSGNGGFLAPGVTWPLYYYKDGGRLGLMGSSTSSGYTVQVNGSLYVSSTFYAPSTCYTDSTIYCHGLWANRTDGEKQVGVDNGTAGNLYLWSNNGEKGLYSGSGYRTGYVIQITNGGRYFYPNTILIDTTISSAAVSQPTALSYGRLQCYGTLCINANTDNSGTEYVILTSGHGVSGSTSDGLWVGSSSAGLFDQLSYSTNQWLEGYAGHIYFGGNFHIDSKGAYHLYLNYHNPSYNIYFGNAGYTIYNNGANYNGTAAYASNAYNIYTTGNSGTCYLTGVAAYTTGYQLSYIYSPCYMSGGNLYAYHLFATNGGLSTSTGLFFSDNYYAHLTNAGDAQGAKFYWISISDNYTIGATAHCIHVGHGGLTNVLISGNPGHGFGIYIYDEAGNNTARVNKSSGVWTVHSSREYKSQIISLPDVGKQIDALRPVSFVYKNSPTNKQLGLIYEEVVNIIPEICTEAEGMKGIEYTKLIPILLKEIQSLRKRILKLENHYN